MSKVKSTLLAAACCALFASAAWAQTASVASSGLGQSWPNAADVSASPQWHVYVFRKDGIKYVQVNDLNGTVHAAIGTANGASIVLPVGVDAQNVQISAATSDAISANPASAVVYHDATTTVTATPMANGSVRFVTVDMCPNAFQCGGGRGG